MDGWGGENLEMVRNFETTLKRVLFANLFLNQFNRASEYGSVEAHLKQFRVHVLAIFSANSILIVFQTIKTRTELTQ
jgi:hypothetical protein